MALSSSLEVVRETLVRITLLLIGLGYGITTEQVTRYRVKILVLSFFYAISLSAMLGINLINELSPISGPVVLIVAFPLSVLNLMFCVWIYFAFRRTLRLLERQK